MTDTRDEGPRPLEITLTDCDPFEVVVLPAPAPENTENTGADNDD
jgi:hypothetical protein